ncbi:hypothetical protein FB451DRAFT_1038664, partial [Mycena latifolia]
PRHHNCVMSATEAPVLLERICSLWRAICLSTSRLWSKIWSKIHIAVPPEQFEEKLLQCIEAAKMWLDRSGECGLSISVQGFQNYPLLSTTPSLLPPIFIPFAFRWEHISLTLPPSVLAPILSRPMSLG